MANLTTSSELTFQERRVCNFLADGKTNKEIAREMGISPRTVEDHRCAVLKKMGVPNAAALVYKVLSARIAELEAANVASQTV